MGPWRDGLRVLSNNMKGGVEPRDEGVLSDKIQYGLESLAAERRCIEWWMVP